jgi:hypothetical protein
MKILKINQEYASLLPPLSPDEFESLKQSIKQNGQRLPIIVNNQGIILDGHHRFRACQELGIEPKYTITTEEFSDKKLLDETLFVMDCNLPRRNLNNFQKAELALKKLKPILEDKAKRNMSIS